MENVANVHRSHVGTRSVPPHAKQKDGVANKRNYCSLIFSDLLDVVHDLTLLRRQRIDRGGEFSEALLHHAGNGGDRSHNHVATFSSGLRLLQRRLLSSLQKLGVGSFTQKAKETASTVVGAARNELGAGVLFALRQLLLQVAITVGASVHSLRSVITTQPIILNSSHLL